MLLRYSDISYAQICVRACVHAYRSTRRIRKRRGAPTSRRKSSLRISRLGRCVIIARNRTPRDRQLENCDVHEMDERDAERDYSRANGRNVSPHARTAFCDHGAVLPIREGAPRRAPCLSLGCGARGKKEKERRRKRESAFTLAYVSLCCHARENKCRKTSSKRKSRVECEL